MKLLIEAKYIPDGTVVTKKTGTQEYIIRDSIKIYTYDTKGSGLKEILNSDGTKYMVSSRGDINMVSGDTVLCMDLSLNDEINLELLQDTIQNVLKSRFPQHEVDVNFDVFIPQ